MGNYTNGWMDTNEIESYIFSFFLTVEYAYSPYLTYLSLSLFVAFSLFCINILEQFN